MLGLEKPRATDGFLRGGKKKLLALTAGVDPDEDIGRAGIGQSPGLAPGERSALYLDDFLLGKSGSQQVCSVGPRFKSLDEVIVNVEAALRDEHFHKAEELWRFAAAMGLDAKQPEVGVKEDEEQDSTAAHSDVPQEVAQQTAAWVCDAALDDLETALDRGDRAAALREHQRLHDLLSACARIVGSPPEDRRGRRAEAETRFRQLYSGQLMCNLFPDIWCLCWDASHPQQRLQRLQ
mmetsp:Transcript_61683/g.178925  ORF Transcript_61683/g.178925 Transcript_61683/m.178925 type:complete len:236 (-) Transcript_61683:220-927(-)